MKKTSKRTLPVVISFFALISAILGLVLPFMYSGIDDKYILGFCVTFGGKYQFSHAATSMVVNLEFTWGLCIAFVLAILSALYSFFICRKTNKANSVITFIVLLASGILYLFAPRFCAKAIQSNVGYQSSTTMSFGPYLVGAILILDAVLALVDTCKKR